MASERTKITFRSLSLKSFSNDERISWERVRNKFVISNYAFSCIIPSWQILAEYFHFLTNLADAKLRTYFAHVPWSSGRGYSVLSFSLEEISKQRL